MKKTINEKELLVLTTKARADEAINSLKGILLGIKMDGKITEEEINELHKWVLMNDELIKRDPFHEFMTIIENTISNGIPPKETIEDLFWLCQKYEADNYYYNAVTTDLQTLQGLCHGILSDGILNDQEIFNLHEWLSSNEHLNSYYPYDEIRSLVLSVVADKKVDEEERLVLKAYFKQFVNLQEQRVAEQLEKETSDISLSALCTSEPEVTFLGKTFCITGILKRGSRESLQENIIKLGGIPVDSVTRKTDYLIVGDNGNQAWTFACYGRKVEKAVNLRKEGHTIMLIHEFDFGDIIDDLL